MYRLSRKRRLLCTLAQASHHHGHVAMTSRDNVMTSRDFHSTAVMSDKNKKSKEEGEKMKRMMDMMMERMGGANKFQYDIILPDEDSDKPLIRFKDVGGHHEAKVELSEIVDFLKNRTKYTTLGAKIPSGALLSGPPGNGKTLLAQAIAGEASVPFINTVGTSFIEKIGGLGPKRVRQLFEVCREHAPCILFIDEIDAVATKRSGQASDVGGRGNEEGYNTLNQILVEMDGISSREEIFVIGATNRDDKLDSALTRPGRLDRKIYIDQPTEIEREEVFKIHLKVLKMDSTVTEQYVKRLATCTPGASGADIANICNEAAIHAARMSSSSVSTADFENALERITAGLEKRVSVVPEGEVELSAYYVAAQSLLSWVLPTLTPVLKVSIVSRVNKPLGFIQFAPRSDLLATKEHLTDLLCRGLAGKASQLLFFNKHTDQAQSDLKRITEVAYNMIAVHGMGVSAPNLSLQSQENSRITMWSNRLQNEIDEEVNHVVQDQYERARDVVAKHKDVIEILAKELIEKKSLAEDDVKSLFESCGMSSR